MDHVQQLPRAFPWRTTALVTAAIAALELLALIAGGATLLVRPLHHSGAPKTKPTAAAATSTRPVVRVPPAPKVRTVPLRPRSQVAVLILNGNGVQGAARTEAAQLQGLGYRIGGAQNAARHDYARSMVMYAPGYGRDARRLARDTGIRMVAPADGMRPAALKASPLVVLLGS